MNQGPFFSFHPKCWSINLTQSADDLFILCGASTESFQLIKQLLDDFYSFSGLKPNMNKCSIFLAGVSEEEEEILRHVLPIPEAQLHVKYLGVPLISTKLKAADYSVLKEKILKRIHSWSTCKLAHGEVPN